ncbi:MAG: hypothetical protein K9H62_15395 [Bacteroidales bacterium]|nr:hypothetical protein [Bacteroidales bacterium]
MKKINIILVISLAVLAFFISCNKEPDLRMPNYDDMIVDAVAFVAPDAQFNLNFLPEDAAIFEGGFTVTIPYNNVVSVDVKCAYILSGEVKEVGTLTNVSTFPSYIGINMNDILGMFSALNSPNDITEGMAFRFYGWVNTLDGDVYEMFLNDGRVNASPDIQTLPGASISTLYKTLCNLVIEDFTGAFNCYEEGYGDYPVNFTVDPTFENRIYNDNYWDWAASGSLIYYNFSGDIYQTIDIPNQVFTYGDGTVGSVEGYGEYDACTGTFWTQTDAEYGGGIYATYHEFSSLGTKTFTYYKGRKADLMK